MHTRSSKAPDPALVSMDVDATIGAAKTNDHQHQLDAIALAATSAPSESSRLAACCELATRWAPSHSLDVIDKITSSARWWEEGNGNGERSEDVRLERCRVLSAALLLAESKNEAAPPLPAFSSSPLPPSHLPPDLSLRVARCLALSLRDAFHEVTLCACEASRLLAGLLVAEANCLSARERALALDSVATTSFPSSSSSSSLPLAADLLVGTLARAAARHRRSAVREAAAIALGALCPCASRSGGELEGSALPALAALAASDPFPRVRAAAVAAAGAALGTPRASAWLAREALPVLALALTDEDKSVAAAAAAALSATAATAATATATAGGGGAGAETGDRSLLVPPPLRTTVSMEDAAAAAAATAAAEAAEELRTTVSMTEAEAEAEAEAHGVDASTGVVVAAFPFARPRALIFLTRCSAPAPAPAPLSCASGFETLSWLVKLVLDDDDGLSENAVLSLSLLPPLSPPFSSSAAFRRSRSHSGRSAPPLFFCLDSDAAAASSARLLWGLVSLCGADIEGNARRERYGARIVRSLLALLRAAAAAAPPMPPALEEEEDDDERTLASSPSSSPPSSLLLLRSASLAAQSVGAWIPVATWLGPATAAAATGSGGGGGAGEEKEGEKEQEDEDFKFDLCLRCSLLRALLFGLEAVSKEKKLEEGGAGAKKGRLLRAGGEVEAVAAVAVAVVAVASSSSSPSPSSSSARSVLSLVSALIGASGDGELRKIDVGRRAELWLSVVASEQELEEQQQREARRRRQGRGVETVSSRLAAACGFASTAALAAEHAPAVLESICRDAPRWTPASPATRLLPALARACDSATLSAAVPRIMGALCEALASERGKSDAVFAAVLLRAGAQVLTTGSAAAAADGGQQQQQQNTREPWRTAAAAAFLSGAALPALSWLPPASSRPSFSSSASSFSRACASASSSSFEGGGFEGADAVRAAASAVVALLCPLLSPGDALALFSGRRQEQQHKQQQQKQQKSPSPFVVAVTSNLAHRGGSGGSGSGSSCAAASCAALGAALAATTNAAAAAATGAPAPFDFAVVSGTLEPGVGALVKALGGASAPGVRAAAAEALGEALVAAAAAAASSSPSPSSSSSPSPSPSSSPLASVLEAAMRALERHGQGEGGARGSSGGEVAEASRSALQRWREATAGAG